MNLTKAAIPDSVTSISEDAFENAPKVTVYASADSYAAEFANSHGIPLNKNPETPDIGNIKIAVNKNMVTIKVLDFIGNGYDCIMGTSVNDGKPVRGSGKLSMNQKGGQVIFRDVPKGVYYAAIHPFTNTDNGKKYSDWTEIKTVKVSLPKGAAGYNFVVGKASVKNDSSLAPIFRPAKIAYQRNGQKKTWIEVKKLKKGNYRIGVQAYNYQNGKKAYSHL